MTGEQIISVGVISVIIFSLVTSIRLRLSSDKTELKNLQKYLATHLNGDKKIRYLNKNNGAGFNGGSLEFSNGKKFIFLKEEFLLKANDLIEATANFEISERCAVESL